MASQSTKLTISEREVSNSRSTRRLRREGQVPGVIYGGGEDAVSFAVDERELRHALAARGAVVELELDGDATVAVLKDAQRHPVRGHTMHVDFRRVRLDVAIHSVVTLELIGGEDAHRHDPHQQCRECDAQRDAVRPPPHESGPVMAR